MSNISIIPARGGSQRIYRKSVTLFWGRPMVSWTIEAARESGVFDRVLVSTDDAKIAETTRTEGAEIPLLREARADDQSPVSKAIITALDRAERHYGTSSSFVTQLMPTCPLRGGAESV